MKNIYLLLSIIGFALPTYFVILESIETGNILLYTDIPSTLNAMFTNRISTIFSIDLFFGVFVFLIWTHQYKSQIGNKKLYLIWLLTFLFGFAFGFPLFLYSKYQSPISSLNQ